MSYHVLLLVILTIVNNSIQTTSDNDVSIDDHQEPLADIANSIRKEQVAENIGSLVQNLMQDGGANVLGNVLNSLGNENAGQLLAGLGSLMAGQDKNKQSGNDNAGQLLAGLGSLMAGQDKNKQGEGSSLLENLGSMIGNMQGGEGGADTILQGLGSILAAQGGGGGGGGGGGFDPSLIGTLLDMALQPHETKKKTGKKGNKKKGNDDFDLSQIVNMAASFIGMQGKQGRQQGGLMSLLPTIIQTINAFSGPEAKERESSHIDHASLLPPFLEKIHVAFDHFMNSALGRQLFEALAGEKFFKTFLDKKGEFDYKKYGEMIENISFRRYWIRTVADRAVVLLEQATDPKIYKQYVNNAMFFTTSLQKSRGFPKETLFDPSRPVESLTALVNYLFKTYFDLKIDSKEYVKPIVEYAQELIKIIETSSPLGKDAKSRELAMKIADTLNLEILEPIIRVNRAYRYGKSQPKCIRYVMCLINEDAQRKDEETIPALKRVLYKGASLVASWYLSSYSDIPFWTLYSDITHSPKCKSLYSEECGGFHVEEMKATTEYVHTEL